MVRIKNCCLKYFPQFHFLCNSNSESFQLLLLLLGYFRFIRALGLLRKTLSSNILMMLPEGGIIYCLKSSISQRSLFSVIVACWQDEKFHKSLLSLLWLQDDVTMLLTEIVFANVFLWFQRSQFLRNIGFHFTFLLQNLSEWTHRYLFQKRQRVAV